jgi:hypothetical protein
MQRQARRLRVFRRTIFRFLITFASAIRRAAGGVRWNEQPDEHENRWPRKTQTFREAAQSMTKGGGCDG